MRKSNKRSILFLFFGIISIMISIYTFYTQFYSINRPRQLVVQNLADGRQYKIRPELVNLTSRYINEVAMQIGVFDIVFNQNSLLTNQTAYVNSQLKLSKSLDKGYLNLVTTNQPVMLIGVNDATNEAIPFLLALIGLVFCLIPLMSDLLKGYFD